MCNHYRNQPDAIAQIESWKEYVSHFDEVPDVDVWPRRKGLVGRVEEGEKKLVALQWGVPLKMKGKRPGTTVTKRITNVRNLKSPFWRSMLTNAANRCVVPFTQFAEPKPNAGREEVWFSVSDSPVAAFAGIWRETDEGQAFAFLTCEPNPLVKPIHPKAMPVILLPEDHDRWLSGEPAEGFQEPFPSQLMHIVE